MGQIHMPSSSSPLPQSHTIAVLNTHVPPHEQHMLATTQIASVLSKTLEPTSLRAPLNILTVVSWQCPCVGLLISSRERQKMLCLWHSHSPLYTKLMERLITTHDLTGPLFLIWTPFLGVQWWPLLFNKIVVFTRSGLSGYSHFG